MMPGVREHFSGSGSSGSGAFGLPTASSAKTGHDFIGDQQGSMPAGNFGDLAKPADGLRDHARRALHQRFENETRVGLSFALLSGEFLLDLINAFPIAFPMQASVGS